MSLSAISVDNKDLSPQGLLVMVANEVGCIVEYGFRRHQYIVRKLAPKNGPIKTLYCAARTNGDVITLCGIEGAIIKSDIANPNFFETLQNALNDNDFMLSSTKDIDTPICNDRVGSDWEESH